MFVSSLGIRSFSIESNFREKNQKVIHTIYRIDFKYFLTSKFYFYQCGVDLEKAKLNKKLYISKIILKLAICANLCLLRWITTSLVIYLKINHKLLKCYKLEHFKFFLLHYLLVIYIYIKWLGCKKNEVGMKMSYL